MSALKLFLFGPPHLEQDGQPINVIRRKPKALLAYLAMAPQSHSRETLTTFLWPEYDTRRARADLSRTLSLLNKCLGAGWLVTDRETVTLTPRENLWIDIIHFKQLLTTCKTHNHASLENCAICLSNLAEAAALYQADFLAGFTLPDSPAFDEWQLFETEGLRQELVSVLKWLGQGYGTLEEWEKAIEYTRRWVGTDPLHEPAHRQLMRLYARSDRRAAALAQYETCCRILIEELNVEPSDETRTLYHQIQAGTIEASSIKVSASWQDTQLPPFLAEDVAQTHKAPVFVARESELIELDNYLAAMLDGRGGIVFISGEAGDGKTALLNEFARRAQQARPDLIVADGNCNAYSGIGDPYLPFRDIMGMLSGDVETKWATGAVTPEQACLLWSLFPQLVQALVEDGPDLIDIFVSGTRLVKRGDAHPTAERTGLKTLQEVIAQTKSKTGELDQRQIFDQFTKIMQRLAASHPLLLLLDDLQWADEASINLLFHLGRRLTGSRILVVGTYRPSEVYLGRSLISRAEAKEQHPLNPIINEFIRQFGEIRIDLGQISAAEGRGFIDALLNNEPNRLGELFRSALFERTKGHALFTVELLRELQDCSNLIQDEAGLWVEGQPLNWNLLPARVEAVIEQRFNRLNRELRDIISVACVEGEIFTAQVVAQIQGVKVRQLIRQLSQELEQRHRLVREYEEVKIGRQHVWRYRFGHTLFQQYLYDKLNLAERRLLHHDVAQALEELFEGYQDEVTIQLAHHYLEAHHEEKAAIYALRAGNQARRRAALDEAVRYYRVALEQWLPKNQAGQAEILWKLGECLWMLGHLPDALKTFEAGFFRFEALGNREKAGSMQRFMGRIYWEQGDRQASLKHYQRALKILEAGPESAELARVSGAFSQMYMLDSEYMQSITWGERAMNLANRFKAEDVIVNVLNNMGISYTAFGDVERGLTMMRESLDRALALNLAHDVCRAYYNLGDLLQGRGHYTEARVAAEKLFAYATRTHVVHKVSAALVRLSEIEWLTGQWAGALARRDEILDWLASHRSLGHLKIISTQLFAQMYNDLGLAELARQTLEEDLSLVRSSAELQTIVPCLGELIRAFDVLDLENEAAVFVAEMNKWIDEADYLLPTTAMYLLFACRWLVARPNTPGSAEVQANLERLKRVETQTGSPIAAACLSEGYGCVALASANFAEAAAQFEQAAAHWESISRPYDLIHALNGLGQALCYTGENRKANQIFNQALRLIEDLASQLEDPKLNRAFLRSSLVQKIRKSQLHLITG